MLACFELFETVQLFSVVKFSKRSPNDLLRILIDFQLFLTCFELFGGSRREIIKTVSLMIY